MTITFIFYFIFFFVCSCAATESESNLIQSSVVFRHGDRSPDQALGIDPLDENAWPQGYKQLTQVGMNQSYGLGRFLRKRYNGLISEDYRKSEIYVISSDKDRAIMTAQAVLAGLYPPSGRQVWNPAIAWQPIPVHTLKGNPLVKPSNFPCPAIKAWRKKHDTLQWEKLLNETDTQHFLTFIRERSGLDLPLKKMYRIQGILNARIIHGFPLPDWVNGTILAKINQLRDTYYMYKYDDFAEQKLAAGSLLGDIIIRMNNTGNGGNIILPKLKLYSAHSGTVTPLLHTLGIYNGISPPFAAALMVELWNNTSNSSAQPHVKFVYRNDSVSPEAMSSYELQVPKCSQPCYLDEFIQLMDGRYYTDLRQHTAECKAPNPCAPQKQVNSNVLLMMRAG